jgi:hypothetical protein
MTAKEFDELIARLASAASRRNAVRGIAGGAIASVGAAPFAAAKSKGKGKGNGKGKKKNTRKLAGSETNAAGKGKRVFCFCPNADPDNCRTRRVKTKKFKKLFRKHRNSHRGPCVDATTTTVPPTTSSPTTIPPTTFPPTSFPPTSVPPTSQEP